MGERNPPKQGVSWLDDYPGTPKSTTPASRSNVAPVVKKNLDWLNDAPGAASAPELATAPAVDDPGLLGSAVNSVKHANKLITDLTQMGSSALGIDALDKNRAQGREMVRMYHEANTDPAIKEYQDATYKRLSNTFSFAGASDILKSLHQGVNDATSHKAAMIGGLADAFVVQPVKDLAQASLGITVGEEAVAVMTPEQRAKAMTNTVANVAIAGAAAGIKGITALATGRRAAQMAAMTADASVGAKEILAARAVTMARVSALQSGSKLVGMVKRGAVAAGEAGALGTTYGMIAGAGDEDQVAQMFAGMVTFASLGVATHAVFGEGYDKIIGKETALAAHASKLAQLRMIQHMEDHSIIQTTRVLNASIDAASTTDAIVNGLLDVDGPTDATLIPIEGDRRGHKPIALPVNDGGVPQMENVPVLFEGKEAQIVRAGIGDPSSTIIRIKDGPLRTVKHSELRNLPPTLEEVLDAQVNNPQASLDVSQQAPGLRKILLKFDAVRQKFMPYDAETGNPLVTHDMPNTVDPVLKDPITQEAKAPVVKPSDNIIKAESGAQLNRTPATPLEEVKVREHGESLFERDKRRKAEREAGMEPTDKPVVDTHSDHLYPNDTTPNAEAVKYLLEEDVDVDASPIILDDLDPRQAKWLADHGYVQNTRKGPNSAETLITRSRLSETAEKLYDRTGLYKGKEVLHNGQPAVITGVDPVITVRGPKGEVRGYESEITERPAPPQPERAPFTPPELPTAPAEATAASAEGVTQPLDAPDSYASTAPATATATAKPTAPPVEPLRNPLIVTGLEPSHIAKLKRAGFDVMARVSDGVKEFLVTKTRLSNNAREMFAKHGLLPNQIVIHDGREVSVVGTSQGGLVKVKDLASDKTYVVGAKALTKFSDFTKFDTPRIPTAKAVYDGMFKKLMERIPDVLPENKSLGDYVRTFLNDMGVKANPEVFVKEMHERLADKIKDGLEPAEKEALEYFRDKQAANFDAWKQEELSSHDALTENAANNDIYVDVDTSRNYVLRDATDGKILGVFSSAREGAEWIKKSGTTNPTDLLNGNGVDVVPNSAKMNPIPGGVKVRNLPKDYNVPEPTRLAKLFAFTGNIGRILSESGTYMKNLDIVLRDKVDIEAQAAYDRQQKRIEQGLAIEGKHLTAPKKGTQFFVRHDQTQDMFMRGYAAMSPHLNDLMELVKDSGKLTVDQRHHITRAVETMNADEVINRAFSRVMSPFEIKMSKWLHDNKIDYMRAREWQKTRKGVLGKAKSDQIARIKELSETYTRTKAEGKFVDDATQQATYDTENATIAREAQAKLDLLRKDQGISPLEEQAAQKFAEIELMDKDEVMLGPIFRLADAYRGGMTRAEYMAKHNFTQEMQKAVYKLDAMYSRLADVFGISAKQRIAGFTSHKQVWLEGNIEKGTAYRGTTPKEQEFYAKLNRVGDNMNYEMDPFVAISKYMRAGFLDAANKHLEASREMWYEDLKKIADPDSRELTRSVIDNYIEGLKGIPGASSKNSELMFENLKKDLRIKSDVKLSDLVNLGLNISGLGTLGFRESVGIRDAMGTVKQAYTFFGTKFTAEALNKSRSLQLAKSLEETGQIKTQSTIVTLTQGEHEGDMIGRGIGVAQAGVNRIANIGMKVSGAKFAYRQLHAGIYQAMFDRVAEVARKIESGEITKTSEAYDHVLLSKFDVPTQKEFINLFESGNYEQAAKFLGRQADNAVVVQYGLANAPYGWRTMRGRVLGQFGSYPIWYLGYMQRLLSTGTWMDKGARLLRMGIAGAALQAAEDGLGIDLTSLHILHPLTYQGGIVVGALQTVNNALGGNGPIAKKAAYSQLMSWLPVSPVIETEDGESYWDGEWKTHINHAWGPGTSAIDGWVRAYDGAQRGVNPLTTGLTATGFQQQKDKESWLSHLLGYQPANYDVESP